MPAAKIAGLGRGQHHHLLRYHQVPAPDRHEAHITANYPLPAGCAPGHVRAALNYLVRRHEVLRTVYDAGARPWPVQRIEPAAPLPVPEVTTEDDGTPARRRSCGTWPSARSTSAGTGRCGPAW